MNLLLLQMGGGGPRMMLNERGASWLGALVALTMFALLVLGAVLITRMIVNRPSGTRMPLAPIASSPTSDAIRILEERFAKGEIDETEFRSKRDTLRS